MKESIGMTVTINIMIIFILMAFAFIMGTVSYSRAFKTGSRIVSSLEKYEGYNELSKLQIEKDLNTIGYNSIEKTSCSLTKKSNGMTGNLQSLTDSPDRYNYCIYKFETDGDNSHYSYGVVVYMSIDFSMFGLKIDLPIFVRSRRIFRF